MLRVRQSKAFALRTFCILFAYFLKNIYDDESVVAIIFQASEEERERIIKALFLSLFSPQFN